MVGVQCFVETTLDLLGFLHKYPPTIVAEKKRSFPRTQCYCADVEKFNTSVSLQALC